MMQATGLGAASLILLAMMVEPSAAAEQRFACKGQIVQEMTNPAVQPKPIDLNVILGRKSKLSMTLTDGKMLAPRMTSNNKIQLKFGTKQFVGEYFHYTGDLFLIYKSGQLSAAELLARLSPIIGPFGDDRHGASKTLSAGARRFIWS